MSTSLEAFFDGTTPVNISTTPSGLPQSLQLPPTGSAKTDSAKNAKSYTLEQVMKNTLPTPFTLKDFANFLKAENASERLDYLLAMEEYKKVSTSHFLEVSEVLMKSNNQLTRTTIRLEGISEEILEAQIGTSSKCTDIKANAKRQHDRCVKLVKTFIQEQSASDVLLSDKIRRTLMEDVDAGKYHPAIFEQATNMVKKKLSTGAFSRFVKHAIRSTEGLLEPPKYSINQIAMNELLPPYSLNNFLDYLKDTKFYSDIVFLQKVHEYQQRASKFFPIGMVNVPMRAKSDSVSKNAAPVLAEQTANHFKHFQAEVVTASGAAPLPQIPDKMAAEDYEMILSKLFVECQEIIDMYVKVGAESQVTLPATLRKFLLLTISQGSIHPDMFNQPYEHIANNLRLSSLTPFLAAQFETNRLEAILEASVPKYTMAQLLNDEVRPPYSRSDFLEYIRDEVGDGNMDFLLTIREYDKVCRPLYVSILEKAKPNEVVNGSKSLAEKNMDAPPVKPVYMNQEDFEALKSDLQRRIAEIGRKFILPGATRELTLPINIRTKLIDLLESRNTNPFIFALSRGYTSHFLQSSSVAKFLRKQYDGNLNAGLISKISKGLKGRMDLLLLDEMPPPYTYDTFMEFCKTQDFAEGVGFVRLVMSYLKLAMPLYSTSYDFEDIYPSALKPSSMGIREYNSTVLKLNKIYEDIFETYLLPNARRRVVTPETIMSNLMKSYEQKVYHPDILTRAYDFFAANLENNVWELYSKYIEPSHSKKEEGDIPRVSIKQLVLNEFASPYSYQDYMNFLKVQMCEECLEFLQAGLRYQVKAQPLYSVPVIKPKKASPMQDWTFPAATRAEDVDERDFQAQLFSVNEYLSNIVEVYIRPESSREVNLPVQVRKPFLKMYDEGTKHPDMLTESIDHIVEMLHSNNLTKFLKSAYQLAPKAGSAKIATPGSEKFTIMQVVLNLIPAPHSTVDFLKYLEAEHSEENLQFLLEVINYYQYCSVLYPKVLDLNLKSTESLNAEQLVAPVAPDGMDEEDFDIILKTTVKMCNGIAKTFLTAGAEKEINIIEKDRKALLAAISAGMYHPEIFKSIFKETANLLRINSLAKFLRS